MLNLLIKKIFIVKYQTQHLSIVTVKSSGINFYFNYFLFYTFLPFLELLLFNLH